MNESRRRFLGALAVPLAGSLALADEKREEKRPRLGVGISSYSIHVRAVGLRDPLAFLKFCQERGAGGVQLPIGMRDKKELAEVRHFLETSGMFLEGSLRCPRDKRDVARFAAEVQAGKEAGATVFRTVMLGSRRYETPDTSRNNPWLALLTMGEGWHNNHHHYCTSARQGFFWWEVDVTYYLLRGLAAVGLIWDIREPPPHVVRPGQVLSASRGSGR